MCNQKPDIYRCIRSSRRDRLGFYAETQIIFGTVCSADTARVYGYYYKYISCIAYNTLGNKWVLLQGCKTRDLLYIYTTFVYGTAALQSFWLPASCTAIHLVFLFTQGVFPKIFRSNHCHVWIFLDQCSFTLSLNIYCLNVFNDYSLCIFVNDFFQND